MGDYKNRYTSNRPPKAGRPRCGSPCIRTPKAQDKFDLDAIAITASSAARLERGLPASQTLGSLDSNIKCGDSLLGIFCIETLDKGIPDAAYKPLATVGRFDAGSARPAGRHSRTGPYQKAAISGCSWRSASDQSH